MFLMEQKDIRQVKGSAIHRYIFVQKASCIHVTQRRLQTAKLTDYEAETILK
jgi:hypothetical protein